MQQIVQSDNTYYVLKTCDRLNPIQPGGGKNAPPGTKIIISSWKWASNVTKLLDFIHFDLTNPMVPNLANGFFSGWVSGTVSRGAYSVLLGQKWLFFKFGHFDQNFKLVWRTFKFILCHQKCYKVFIYILEIQQHKLQCHGKSQTWKSKGGHFCPPPGQEQSEIARAEQG